ncbi:MAG: hypothetical protein GVY04_05055 [Cyanobacteria bacterium]|jgi:hypothetical protein|nr:hypothetical protein [Cyanobacteria bacterium GSL.Bin1]
MLYKLKCPSCQSWLYNDAPTDNCRTDEVICRQCHHKYKIIQLQVQQLECWFTPATSRYQKPSRRYQLRGTTADGETQAYQFSISGDEFVALAGDELLLVYATQLQKVEKLALINNLTTEESRKIFSPRTEARQMGVATGAILFVGGSLLAGLLSGVPAKAVSIASVPISGVAGLVTTKRCSYREENQSIINSLDSQQQLLAETFCREEKSLELQTESRENQRLLQRARHLKEKMRHLDEEMYAHQLNTVNRAIATLEKNADLINHLIEGHQWIIATIEIKRETLSLSNQLPTETQTQVLAKLDELNQLEQEKESLKAELDGINLAKLPK